MAINKKVGGVYVDAELKDKQFQSQAGKFTKSVDNLGKKTGSSLKSAFIKIAPVIAGVFSVKAIVNFTKKSDELYQKQRLAEAQLTKMMKNTGVYTQDNIDAMKSYASELQNVTDIGDESIMPIIADLSKAKLSTDQLKRATESYLDLQKAGLGGETLARALEKPLEFVTQLRRQGILINQETLKSLDLEGQRALILDEIQKKYGGLARSLVDTNKQISNVIGDIYEKFGKLMSNILEPFKKNILGVFQSIDSFLAKKDLQGFAGSNMATGKELSNTNELISRYEELSKKVNKTNEEKTEYAKIQNDLIKTMPDLKNAINIETGELDVNSDAWNNNTLTKKLALQNLQSDSFEVLNTIADRMGKLGKKFNAQYLENNQKALSLANKQIAEELKIKDATMIEGQLKYRDELQKTIKASQKYKDEYDKYSNTLIENIRLLINSGVTEDEIISRLPAKYRNLVKLAKDRTIQLKAEEEQINKLNAQEKEREERAKRQKLISDVNDKHRELLNLIQEQITPMNEIDSKLKSYRDTLKEINETGFLSKSKYKEAEDLIIKLDEKLKQEKQDQLSQQQYAKGIAKSQKIKEEQDAIKQERKEFYENLLSGIISAVQQGISEGYEMRIAEIDTSTTEGQAEADRLTEESKRASDGMSVVADTISNFQKGGWIGAIIGWIIKIVSIASKFSSTLGRMFALVGTLFEFIGTFVGVISELIANFTGLTFIVDLLNGLFSIFSIAIEMLSGVLKPVTDAFEWVAKQITDFFNGIANAMRKWGIDVGVIAPVSNEETLQETNDKLQELIDIQEENLSYLTKLKDSIEKVSDIQKQILDLNNQQEVTQFGLDMNKQIFTGLLGSLSSSGSLRSDFNTSLYQSIIKPDGTIDTVLAQKLLMSLNTAQLDASKIYDPEGLAQLKEVISSMINNQNSLIDITEQSNSLQEDYVNIQKDLNEIVLLSGYNLSEFGTGIEEFVSEIRTISFADFRTKTIETARQLDLYNKKIATATSGVQSPKMPDWSGLKPDISWLQIAIDNLEDALNINKVEIANIGDAPVQKTDTGYDPYYVDDGTKTQPINPDLKDLIENFDAPVTLTPEETKKLIDSKGIDLTKLPKFHTGGYIGKYSSMKNGEIPILAQSGEYVMGSNTVNRIGVNNLDKLNNNGNISGNVTVNINKIEASDYIDFVNKMNNALNDKGLKVEVKTI